MAYSRRTVMRKIQSCKSAEKIERKVEMNNFISLKQNLKN